MYTSNLARFVVALCLIVACCLSCSNQSAEDSKGRNPKNKVLNTPAFKVVSAYWTSAVQTSSYPGASVVWNTDEDKGLIVIVKRPTDKELFFHTNDFVLAFMESAMDIPRRPCYGISYGMKSTTEEIRWGALGSVGRTWINQGEQYFALLFGDVPKKIKTFTLYTAAPVGPEFTAQEPQRAGN